MFLFVDLFIQGKNQVSLYSGGSLTLCKRGSESFWAYVPILLYLVGGCKCSRVIGILLVLLEFS